MEKDERHSKGITKQETNLALQDILFEYPSIPISDIKSFSAVYYPIAIIELDMDQESFENFEMVEYVVLKMIKADIKSPDAIAKSLGLSELYVKKIIRILAGTGQVSYSDHIQITPLGIESLNGGRKKTIKRSWQRFQIDALNGTLMKLEQVVDNNALNERSETDRVVGHLDFLEGVSLQTVSDQIAKNNLNNYIKQGSGIVNSNVVKINDAKCMEIKYAKSYLMDVIHCKSPIIFAKRYNVNGTILSERFGWKPFCRSNDDLDFGFSDVPVETPKALGYVMNINQLLMDKRKSIDWTKEIPGFLSQTLSLTDEMYHIVGHSDEISYVILDGGGLTVFNNWFLDFLYCIGLHGFYLCTGKYQYGHLTSISTKDTSLLEIGKRLYDVAQKQERKSLFREIKNKFHNITDNDLLKKIMEFLQEKDRELMESDTKI